MSHALAAPAFAYCAQPVAIDWLGLVAGLAARPGFWWLDSALAQPPLGRFSFAGAEPGCELRARGERIACELRRAPWSDARVPEGGDALAALRALLPARGELIACASPARAELPFVGGLIAALGYELGARFESTPVVHDDAPLPFADATALGVDRLFAFDHLAARAYAVALCAGESERAAADAARDAARELAAGAPQAVWSATKVAARAPRRGLDAEQHGKAVAQIRERIAAGDLYQACLKHRI